MLQPVSSWLLFEWIFPSSSHWSQISPNGWLYLPQSTDPKSFPRIQWTQNPFSSLTQSCVISLTPTQETIQTTHLSGVRYTRPSSYLVLMCWIVIIFSFQNLSILSHVPSLSVHSQCSLFDGGYCSWYLCPHSTQQCNCLHISSTEWAGNKYVFIDNWLKLSPPPPPPHEDFINPSTQINAPIFFLVGKLPSHYSASGISAFLKCLVGE